MWNGFATLALVASIAGTGAPPRDDHRMQSIRASIAKVAADAAASDAPRMVAPLPAAAKWPPPQRRRSPVRVAAGVVIGGAAGFFAGGFVGYKIERTFADCKCDDPGLKGLVIGAPVGAILGAIIGGKLF